MSLVLFNCVGFVPAAFKLQVFSSIKALFHLQSCHHKLQTIERWLNQSQAIKMLTNHFHLRLLDKIVQSWEKAKTPELQSESGTELIDNDKLGLIYGFFYTNNHFTGGLLQASESLTKS